MKNLAYQTPEGKMHIVIPAIQAKKITDIKTVVHSPEDVEVIITKETDTEFLERIMPIVLPKDAINPTYVDTLDIPTDRYFRQSWKIEANKVDIDMVKAEKFHMDNIRASRNKQLDLLDKKQMAGKDVVAQKQALRDLPATMDLTVHKTPEALKNAWSDLLPLEDKPS